MSLEIEETNAVKPLSLAVFVGPRGRGSNLMALHAAAQEGRLSARIVAVIAGRKDAPALIRAEESGIPTFAIDPKRYEEDEQYGAALMAILRDTGADTIALAGYLRRLPTAIVEKYRHRIVNVHPALLPAFGGKGMYGHHVHHAVLEYGVKVSGCTVHFVDEAYDTGPIILQKVVPVEEDDTPETLAARVLTQEHAAYIEALQLLAEGRLSVEGRIVRVSG
jgi:formyltetrahydrofolate-dependent phosphoribosylglycinamide formyltransferase